MDGWPLSFRDADFPHAFMWAQRGAEPVSRRWLPYGMPQFNERLLGSVFFLYRKGSKPDEHEGPFGTGVIVGAITWDPVRVHHYYAVTAHHIQDLHRAYEIRINTHDGDTIYIDIDAHEWVSEVGGPDIAATDVTEHMGAGGKLFSYVPLDMFCDEAFFKKWEVNIGEDGFMIGLFADLPGTKKNMIAGRFGNVALLANDDAKVELHGGKKYPVHLFDVRSRPGFSGSPVWIYRIPTNDLRPTDPTSFIVDAGNRFMGLLGIHVEQFNDYVDEIRVDKSRLVKTGLKFQIPNSVTVVVPAWEIIKLLNHQTLDDQRKVRVMEEGSRRLAENVPTPEATPGVESERPATPIEGDDQHKERFTALLDAAVGKPKQGG